MEVNIRKEEKALVVSVTGRMDAVSAPDFDTQVEERVDKGETNLVLDLSGLDYISSAGLRSMLTLAKKLKTKEGDLVLFGLQDVVNEVFEVSGFSTIFEIFGSLEEAMEGR
ncbi:MAG: STAS domain-containing protein [Desulfobacteraceae bacterium]|nr:STAS domain-containing protein [Desulfobacteraceae bacterium]